MFFPRNNFLRSAFFQFLREYGQIKLFTSAGIAPPHSAGKWWRCYEKITMSAHDYGGYKT